MRKQWLVLACGMAMAPALLPATGYADDAKADATTAKEKAWDIELSASYLLKNGNSNGQSFVGKLDAGHEGVLWRQTLQLEAVNTMSENDDGEEERTAERYYASYKLDRKFGNSFYLFNVVTYEKDLFSGYQYQASYAIGLGRRFIDTETQTLDLEAGPGFRTQCLEPEDSYFNCQNTEDSLIGRLAGKYKWKISDVATFSQSVSTEIGEQNTSVRSETALTSQINEHFAMRLSYLLTRDSYVPDGTHKTDTETAVSLVYTF